jgi:prolyl-tRNA synthetase
VSRAAAAAIEQNHDDKGICWPVPIAPFHAHILSVTASEEVRKVTDQLYQDLSQKGIEVLLDDREERGGVKFNDADLIGIPFQVIVGDKGLAKNTIEIKNRKTGEKFHIPREQVCEWVITAVQHTCAPQSF